MALVRQAAWCVVLALAIFPGTALGAALNCPDIMTSAIPARQPDAATGSEFAARVDEASGPGREDAIAAELLAGNIPRFLRRLKPVDVDVKRPGRPAATVTICVMPDYLAIGSARDFLHIPMALPTALEVSRAFGFILPTRRIVDAIYEQATVRLQPEPLPAGDQMRSTGYYVAHDLRVAEQRAAFGAGLGELISGHKKDLVITGRLWTNPQRVAIYGWHRPDGHPIQPLSTVHGARYADYSHGVRLVSLVGYVDGQPRSLIEALEDPDLAAALTGEGPIQRVDELVDELGRTPDREIAPLAEKASDLVRRVSDMTGQRSP